MKASKEDHSIVKSRIMFKNKLIKQLIKSDYINFNSKEFHEYGTNGLKVFLAIPHL